jgi:succinate-acetate transporter protein
MCSMGGFWLWWGVAVCGAVFFVREKQSACERGAAMGWVRAWVGGGCFFFRKRWVSEYSLD